MNDLELSTTILPELYGLRLKIRLYFESELPYGSSMSEYYLINEKINFLDVKFGDGDFPKLSNISKKTAP